MTAFVKYVGTSHWRAITRQDWANIPDNPIDHPTLRWDRANGWTVPRSRISDEAWPYIQADPEFVLVGENDRQVADAEHGEGVVNVRDYPPLVTAETAELMDQAAADVTANEQLDNESGGTTTQASVDNAPE